MAPAQPAAYAIDRTAMAAYPSHLLASTSGCRWLMLAAQTAGLASGGWRPAPHPSAGGRVCPPRIATRTLGGDAGSVRTARDFTLATLHRWGPAERRHDIAIVVSELVTSALRHARPVPGDTRLRRTVRLGLLQPGPSLLCAVADLGTAAPVRRDDPVPSPRPAADCTSSAPSVTTGATPPRQPAPEWSYGPCSPHGQRRLHRRYPGHASRQPGPGQQPDELNETL